MKGVPAAGCERGGDAAMRLRGTVASASTIFALRSCAVCASSVMSAASGRLCQQRVGISFFIMLSLSRAGLKMWR